MLRKLIRPVIRRFVLSFIGGVAVSLVVTWTLVILTFEFPLEMRKLIGEWHWGDTPVWAGREYYHFRGAEGHGRRWSGDWYSQWQGVEMSVFARDYEYENPETINPNARYLELRPPSQLPNWSRIQSPPDGTESEDFMCHEVGAGWPWVAWHGACVINYTEHVQRGGTAWNGRMFKWPAVESVYWSIPLNISQAGFLMPSGKSTTMLPLRPIFPEAIYSATFYGSFVLALILLRDALKARKRRRRHNAGRCTRCGYQLAQADPCPECGEPVSRTKPLKSPA